MYIMLFSVVSWKKILICSAVEHAAVFVDVKAILVQVEVEIGLAVVRHLFGQRVDETQTFLGLLVVRRLLLR